MHSRASVCKQLYVAAFTSLLMIVAVGFAVPAQAAGPKTSMGIKVLSSDSIPQPYVYIFNWHSGKCINVPGEGSQQEGLQLDQWTCQDWASEEWQPLTGFGPVGEFIFRNRATLQCINVRGYSTQEGAAIQQWPCHLSNPTNPPNETFYADVCSARYDNYNWCEYAGLQSNLCLNVVGNSLANGAKIQQWDCGFGYYNEVFALVVSDPVPPCPCSPVMSSSPISRPSESTPPVPATPVSR